MPNSIGLYIHIPFCKNKCPYCDFHSAVSRVCTDEYIDSLVDEAASLRRMGEYISDREKIAVDTIYFGGGTPSLMSDKQLLRVLSAVKDSFYVKEDCEITLECNPSSENLEKLLTSAVSFGVNRISLGMQSSTDSERKKLGRRGTAYDVERAVEISEKAGIDNISLDVMIGVPDSNTDTLRKSLDFALRLGVPHISAYMLKIEEGTYYYKNAKSLNIPTEDETADMYLFMSEYLTEKGYLHYEISNFCKDGLYSRHNMKYWEGAPYIGFGAAAHSFFGGKRFYFPRDTEYFTDGGKVIYDGEGGDDEERILLSLRTYKGISLHDKNALFTDKARFFEKHGFGVIKDDRFILTASGFLLSNTIISELLSVY